MGRDRLFEDASDEAVLVKTIVALLALVDTHLAFAVVDVDLQAALVDRVDNGLVARLNCVTVHLV